MGFSGKQLHALRRNVDLRCVRTREINGRELSYVEGWYAISAANRIFGFDGWSRETIDAKCVLARENRGAFIAVYTAKVRITVFAGGTQVVREGHGTGEGRGGSPGEAHDTGLKAAETDATKRALTTFGRPFGLELYRADKAAQSGKTRGMDLPAEQAPPLAQIRPVRLEDAKPHPDDGTPIPRPSSHYGLQEYLETREARGALVRKAAGEARAAEQQAHRGANRPERPNPDPASDRNPTTTSAGNPESGQPQAPTLVPEGQHPERIDKSALPFGEPKRLRDKNHLRFIASQPCLVCGRQPSDAHHLRFAQPRALGLKVSDEFTVPLCRSHHRNLHQAGNEVRWWENFRMDPMLIARQLWEEMHPKTVESHAYSQPTQQSRPGAAGKEPATENRAAKFSG